MSKRSEHTFTFTAGQISEAARVQAEHHEERAASWADAQRDAIEELRRTVTVELKEYEVTGGVRVDFAVDYGDGATHRRMVEAASKVRGHQDDAKRFRVTEALYGSQPPEREYEVDADDVLDLRLDQDPARGVR